MEANITYRDITDEGLISFCHNNLTDGAKYILGVFQDVDGVTKVNKEHYVMLIQLYFEVGAISEGEFDGKIHIESHFDDKTDILM